MSMARKIVRRASKEFLRGNKMPVAVINHFRPEVLDKYAMGIKRDVTKTKAGDSNAAEAKA
jgi:hypothetical protein